MNKNKNSDIQYRRGIVLGLTFAELLILLLFVLLLVLGVSLERNSNANSNNNSSSNAKQYNEKELSEMSSLSSLLKKKNESSYEEAKRLINKGEDEKAYQALLGLPADSTKKINGKVSQVELAQMSDVIAYVKSNNPTAYVKIQKYIKSGEIEKAYQELIESSSIVKSATNEVQVHKNMISDCRAQNKHLVNIKNIGRGGDFPSCWFDETGAKQFLYNIELTDKGIVVYDNPIPSREQEKKTMPLTGFKLGSPMQPSEFMKAGQKIRKMSDDNSCRYFVKIADKTSPDSKEHYKKLRTTVENIFYKKDV